MEQLTEQQLIDLGTGRALAASGRARLLREAAAITQSEIARALGVQPAAVSRWERGIRRPTGTAGSAYGALLIRLSALGADSG